MTEVNYAGIVSYSTIDYPQKSAAVIYLCGCPYRCPWCQNPELALGDDKVCRKISISELVKQLNENYLIDAVCVTGGEPLMQVETLDLLKEIKEKTTLLLKIDHNCFFPEQLEKALAYLDLLTVDIKAPLNEKYGAVVGLPNQWKHIVDRVGISMGIIKKWSGKKEARTTIVPGLIDKDDEIYEIAKVVRDVGFDSYVLQQFRPDKTLDPEFGKIKSPSLQRMRELGKIAKQELPNTEVRIVTSEGGGFETIK